jgi:hypothetical protein
MGNVSGEQVETDGYLQGEGPKARGKVVARKIPWIEVARVGERLEALSYHPA